MKLTEILTESEQQQLDELDIGKAATAVGKGIGAVGKGIGAVAGVPQGIGRAIKKGYKSAVSTIGRDDEQDQAEPTAPAAQSQQPKGTGMLGAFKAGLQGQSGAQQEPATAQPTAQQVNKTGPAGTPPAQNLQGAAKAAADKTAAATAGQDAAQAGQTLYAQVKANVNKLDKKGKQRILALLQKSLAQPAAPAATPAAAPAATTSTTPAKPEKAAPSFGKGTAMPTKPMQIPGAGTNPTPAAKPTGAGVKQMAKPARNPKKAALLQPQTASVHRTEPALSESYRSIFVRK